MVVKAFQRVLVVFLIKGLNEKTTIFKLLRHSFKKRSINLAGFSMRTP